MNKKKNSLSLNGQLIEINGRKYGLLEFKNDGKSFTSLKPMFSLIVDITATKWNARLSTKELNLV